MATRTVTSAAGDKIEILPDDDWVSATEGTIHGMRLWMGLKPLMLKELWNHGAYTDKSGQASSQLWNDIQANNPNSRTGKQLSSVISLINQPQNALMIERVIKGRRTFSIKLVALPERWYKKLQADLKHSTNGTKPTIDEAQVTVYDSEGEPHLETLVTKSGKVITEEDIDQWAQEDEQTHPLEAEFKAALEPEEFAPALDVQIANQVAVSLLTTVVEIISAGKADPESSRRLQGQLDQSQALLSQRLEENSSLRKRLREASDQLHAVITERDSLRQRLRQTEYNLNQALKGEAAQAINAEIHKRVDQIMRTAPTTAKGDD